MKAKKIKLLVLPAVLNMQQVVDRFPFPVVLTKGNFSNLEIVFENGKIEVFHKGIDLRSFSFVWLCSSWGSRDLAYALKLYLNKNNIPNTYIEKGTSKLTDHMAFSLGGIPSPNTLFLGSRKIEKSLSKIKEVCGYPLVIKDIKGSRGMHSLKVKTEKELLEKIKTLPRYKKYLFQRYVPNKYDWGLMVADGVVVSGEKSYPCDGEFRNNTCNGAKEVFVDPEKIPQHLKQMAVDASDSLGLKWSRADIIIDSETEKPYVLEVNRLPGITSKTSEVEGAYRFISSQMAAFMGRAKQEKLVSAGRVS